MEPSTSPNQKKSPVLDPHNLNTKNSVTCSNVPEELFNAESAKKHFSKFGRVQRIRLFPKRQMCMIEYDQPAAAERAVLNAGAFDGFMFDVTRTKQKIRRRSKREDDPEWLPDPDLQEELSAMSGSPLYRAPRQTNMEMDVKSPTKMTPQMKQIVVRKKLLASQRQPPIHRPQAGDAPKPAAAKPIAPKQQASGTESPVAVFAHTTISTADAAAELAQLAARVAATPDEQWRVLDARDKILRSWGGAGSRVVAGGATIGTCPDMCPEKERLHRQAEHQVMNLEASDADGQLDARRAVKQYSRSSADQEIPMCYELRPAAALVDTCAYLLHEIADTNRPISLADWFHFLWDRFRGIRKDITQQALCCADSIRLVEMCARFHAHCAARLADLEHTQFDQKLNTDNLTKCLQTLKHMYADVGSEAKPREPEFRGYVALLNLGDSNFWWEIKQLPQHIQKSAPISFAIKVFNALDNNNYVRFFRLVREEATYLQACILLRYFNDVRARALARTVKAFAPRGGSRYPAEELMDVLAFESLDSLRSFVSHYGLRFGVVDDSEASIILDRNHFYEDSDPYPISRAVNLIESKRNCSVGQVIAGGALPPKNYANHVLYNSFNSNGKMRLEALLAEDLNYNTNNDTLKDVRSLKAELTKLLQGGPRSTLFVKSQVPEPRSLSPKPKQLALPQVEVKPKFSFKPAIPVAPTEIIKTSPEKIFSDGKTIFSFSKPQDTTDSKLWSAKDTLNIPKPIFGNKTESNVNNVFKQKDENKDPSAKINLFKSEFGKPNIFGQTTSVDKESVPVGKNLFSSVNKIQPNVFMKSEAPNLFSNKPSSDLNDNIFNQNKEHVFAKPNPVAVGMPGGLFSKSNIEAEDAKNDPKNVFSSLKPNSDTPNIFSQANMSTGGLFSKNTIETEDAKKDPKNIFGSLKPNTDMPNIFGQANGDSSKTFGGVNGETNASSLFKSVAKDANSTAYSIFQSKNATENSIPVLKPVKAEQADIYEFDEQKAAQQEYENLQRLQQEQERKRIEEEERIRREELRKQEEEIQKMKKLEEERRIQALKKQKEIQRLEEERKKEELRKQEELRKKLEEEKRIAEMKRRAEEEKIKFRERVEKESEELIEELLHETNNETVAQLTKEELDKFKALMKFADEVTDELLQDMCKDMTESEMKAEKFWTEKLLKKWCIVWRRHLLRNRKRRNLLDDTPVWLPDQSPVEKASYLRRFAEKAALKNMNAIHKGYRFTGELKQPPTPDPYNVMEVIRSSLLKRMKEINYPYDKCFFWKVALLSPGAMKYICRKIDIEKWLLAAFSDKKAQENSETLIQVGKQSWNNLMEFAISVSLANSQETKHKIDEAIEGSNGLLFYATENETLIQRINDALKPKYLYQVLPLAIVMPRIQNELLQTNLEAELVNLVNSKSISNFKIFTIDSTCVTESLKKCTKNALKWLARNYPVPPPLEIDYIKSICQRYLGNEIWNKLKTERENRIGSIFKDLHKLVSLYNTAVDKLTSVITNEDLFNYPPFPIEFKQYLDENSPYPKPYEFIPCNVRNSENISQLKETMKQLKLPSPQSSINPLSVQGMQDEMRTYCKQIGWFEDPEKVVCKAVAVLPNEICDETLPQEEFSRYLEHYDLLDLLNIIVYEKINHLNNFDNRYAMYESSTLQEYKNFYWWYETDVVSTVKHKPVDYRDDDDVDYMLTSAKRRKLEESFEYLMLEDNDITMVEDNIKGTDEKIIQYNNCSEQVKELEQQLEKEKMKSLELENILKAALADVECM